MLQEKSKTIGEVIDCLTRGLLVLTNRDGSETLVKLREDDLVRALAPLLETKMIYEDKCKF